MGYNSTLPTTKIEGALLASLKTKKIEYNITQDKSSNYASLAEAIAAVDDDEYKVKGIVLTFYTGTEWMSKRYNGEDASGFADEGNWIDVGGAAGGTQYLDLSMFSEESGTLSEEDYQKVVKAYENGVIIGSISNVKFQISIVDSTLNLGININAIDEDSEGIIISTCKISINKNDKTYIGSIADIFKYTSIKTSGFGTKALTDNGQYAEFAKPSDVNNKADKIEIEDHRNEELGGTLSLELKPNKMYLFQNSSKLNLTLSNDGDSYVDEFIFEIYTSSMFQMTLSLPESVKWVGGEPPVLEEGKTYQFSIVNNLAVYAAF